MERAGALILMVGKIDDDPPDENSNGPMRTPLLPDGMEMPLDPPIRRPEKDERPDDEDAKGDETDGDDDEADANEAYGDEDANGMVEPVGGRERKKESSSVNHQQWLLFI